MENKDGLRNSRMNTLDLLLLIIISILGLMGFFLGFIHSVGSLLGMLLASFLAGRYFQVVGGWLSAFMDHETWAMVLGFLLLFIIISKITGILFSLVNIVFHIISFLPFLKTLNRLLGAALGCAEGILFASILLYILARYPLHESLTNLLLTSRLAPSLISIASLLAPLLPDMVNKLESVI